MTNLRIAGNGRKPGSVLINIATVLLFALAVALYVVSINAQMLFVMNVKHDDLVSWIEAASLDGGMVIFTLLALGLSRAGQAARIERLLITICAAGSAAMNYEAAATADLKSALAYTVPPLFLAVVVDRTVSVIRRHYLGDEDASAWSALGRVGLYLARFAVAPPSTVLGLRRALLHRTPVPGRPAKPARPVETTQVVPAVVSIPQLGPVVKLPPAAERPALPRAASKPRSTGKPRSSAKPRSGGKPRSGSKQQALISLAIEQHGLAGLPLDEVSRLATSLAAEIGLHPATARRVLLARARQLASGGDTR